MSEETKIYYKGFEKGLVCRGFQYKEGEWQHVADKADLCNSGVHACEAPLDVFNYYPPATSEFHAVELKGVSDQRESNDTKVCATDIKVGAKLSIKNLIHAQIEFVKSKTVKCNESTGDGACNESTGYGACNESTGNRACNESTGNRACNESTGYGACNESTGYGAKNSSSGHASINVGWGRFNKCKGAIGNYLVLSEWGEWDGEKYPLICAKMTVVDGETIKADTWYMLKNGEFVEADE